MPTSMAFLTNKYSGYCFRCGKAVEVGEGYAEIYKGRWGVRCRPVCGAAQRNEVRVTEVACDSAEHDAGAEVEEGGQNQLTHIFDE